MTATNEDILSTPEVLFLSGADAIRYSTPTYFTMRAVKEYPEYEYIWVIEYDVCYSGNWRTFFEKMNKLPHDLICSRILSRRNDSGWRWWNDSDVGNYTFAETYHALNCISRLSREIALKINQFYVDNCHRGGTFFENIWATIAMNEGTCYDLYNTECHPEFNFHTRCGDFVKNPMPDKLYHAIKDHIRWEDVCHNIRT
jgi:hypothetical protein